MVSARWGASALLVRGLVPLVVLALEVEIFDFDGVSRNSAAPLDGCRL